MKKLLMIISIIVYSLVKGQAPEILWQQCIGTDENNYVWTICNTDNGYLIGSIVSSPEGVTNFHGAGDIWVVNIDSTGNIIWEKCFGGSDGESPVKIIRINNDYIILGGTTSYDGDIQSINNGGIDYWVVKINQQGDIIWEKCYGTPNNEGPNDILSTPDGGLLVMGRIHSSGGDVSIYYGSNDVWMFKTDSLGNIEWERTLGNQYNDNGVSIMLNSEGNIMLIGAVAHYGGMVECDTDDYLGDVWLVELNLQGNIISQHCYGGSYYDLGYSIIELTDGYIFSSITASNDGDVSGLHGPPGGPPNGWEDIWIVRLNNQFEIEWQKCFGGYNTDAAYYITQTNDNAYLIIGMTYSNDGDVSGNHSMPGIKMDIWAVKLDSTGEIEWQKCYGGWGSERLENPHTILKKGDYNYVIASSSDYSPSYDVQCGSISGVDRDAWIFEIDIEDTTGIFDTPAMQDNVSVYPNPAKDYVIFELSTTNYNNVISTLGEGHSAGRRNLPAMKESQRINGSRSSKGIPHPTAKSQPKGFGMTASNGITVVVFNIFGQEVIKLPIMDIKTVWDTREVKNGIYFYHLEIEGKMVSGKVVVQK